MIIATKGQNIRGYFAYRHWIEIPRNYQNEPDHWELSQGIARKILDCKCVEHAKSFFQNEKKRFPELKLMQVKNGKVNEIVE